MPEGLAGMYTAYNPAAHWQDEFRYDSGAVLEYVLGGGGEADQGTSMWSHQSLYSGSSGTDAAPRPARALPEKGNDSLCSSGGHEEANNVKGDGSDMSGLFGSDCREHLRLLPHRGRRKGHRA
ncbi:transcription factor MYB80-like [Setaria viridis]|uniref:transcription factor MYB80-like n=1 Tax=Setaria viridis TaxID=4556 RepID=UPI003B3BC08B